MRTRKGAFTLVELLVVIAILGVLAGLLLPVLAKVRERGRVVKAQSDISMIAAACTSYSRTWGCFPPDLMPGAASEHPNTPNECLVFFANTAFKPSSSDGNRSAISISPLPSTRSSCSATFSKFRRGSA